MNKNHQIYSYFKPYDLKNFKITTLEVHSKFLKNNPLNDPYKRVNPMLTPIKESKTPLPVVFILAGFSGNGLKYFNTRFHEDNFPQIIDRQYTLKHAPKAHYVFVDALTFWGGSQFINSSGTGKYEDYIIKELVPLVRGSFLTHPKAEKWCVMGGSSGGYGALHLSSKYPDIFGTFAATAPDSYFNLSLLPDIYKATPSLEKYNFSLKKIKDDLQQGSFFKSKSAFSTLNAIGMGSCYAPKQNTSKKWDDIFWPIQPKTGAVHLKNWNKWLQHDPVNFLKKRNAQIKRIKYKFLDVGQYDEYHLQFGSRMIKQVLKNQGVDLDYSEFLGSHSDISKRRPEVLKWLKNKWKT